MNRDSIRLIGLRSAVSNGAKPGALPTQLKVLGWGLNKTLKGDFIVDERTVAVFDANQRAVGRDRVVLDYEHNTVPGTEEYNRTKEPRDVAAYWTPKVIPGEGVVLEAPRWIAEEKEVLKFEDISAAPFIEGNRVIGLHSVALTRAGASDFTFFSAPEIEAMVQTLSVADNQGKKSNMQITLAALAALLGLSESASEADVKAKLGHVATLSTQMDAMAKRIAEMASGAAAGNVIVLPVEGGAKTELSLTDLAQKVLSLEANAVNADRMVVLNALSAEGKAPVNPDTNLPYSADELGKLDVKTLKTLRANTPGVVPLSAMGRVRGGATAVTPENFQVEVGKFMAAGMNRDAATVAARQKLGC